jgi:rubredoxin
MNQWECEECGAVANNRPRKNAIAFACDQRCRWVFNPQSSEDAENGEEKGPTSGP